VANKQPAKCHNVTQAGTKVNYCNFRCKLFYALTTCGSVALIANGADGNGNGSGNENENGAFPSFISLSAAIFGLQLFLQPLHMAWGYLGYSQELKLMHSYKYVHLSVD